jgi:urease accessory protein
MNATGELRISASLRGRRTVLSDSFRTSPFHIGVPAYRAGSGAAELIVQEVGPGRLPGDHLRSTIRVREGASLTARAQGANRIYPSNRGEATSERVDLVAEDASRLIYLPGEIIAYRCSVYRQRTRISVFGSGFVALREIVTPGRVAMGETNIFSSLELELEAQVDGQPCFLERSRLEPSLRELPLIGRHGAHNIAGALYIIGAGVRIDPPRIDDDAILLGCASGEGYAMARVLGPTVQRVAAIIGWLLASALS